MKHHQSTADNESTDNFIQKVTQRFDEAKRLMSDSGVFKR